MNLGDILGILFLIFFVILPALQGFLRRSQNLPQDFEPDEIPLPGEQPKPVSPQTSRSHPKQESSQTAQSRPNQTPSQSAGPQTRPTPSQTTRPQPNPASQTTRPQQPTNRPAPPPRPAAKPTPTPTSRPLVSEPVKPTPKKQDKTPRQLEHERFVQQSQSPAQAGTGHSLPPVAIAEREPRFSTSQSAILSGMVWAQVLSEPRGKYWRKTRKPRR